MSDHESIEFQAGESQDPQTVVLDILLENESVLKIFRDMTAKMESLFLENSRLNSRVTNLDQEMATLKSRPFEMSHSLARPELQFQNLPTIERNEDLLQRGQNAANLDANPEPQSTMAGHDAQSQGSSTAELEARNEWGSAAKYIATVVIPGKIAALAFILIKLNAT